MDKPPFASCGSVQSDNNPQCISSHFPQKSTAGLLDCIVEERKCVCVCMRVCAFALYGYLFIFRVRPTICGPFSVVDRRDKHVQLEK